MIYDHHRGALQSNQQKIHDTAYSVMTINIVNKGTKEQNKKEQKNKNRKSM